MWVSVCVYVSCIYVCVCTESRGCRRRCADETAAQRCGSGAPTLVHFSLCQHNAEEVRHILEANISHDTTNDPAHQRHAAFPPACFALPSGTAPRKRTSHQDLANPHGTATSRTYFGRGRSVHTLEANISHDTANDPTHQRHAAFTPACFALPIGTVPRKRTSRQGRANPNGTATSRTYTVCPHTT